MTRCNGSNQPRQPTPEVRLAACSASLVRRVCADRSPTKCTRVLPLIVSVVLVLAGCRTEAGRSTSTSSPDKMDVSGSAREPVIAAPLSASEATNRPCIYISREVKRPGVYSWSSGMTLTDAIASAGGFTEFAGRSRIRVFRKDYSVGRYDYDQILKQKTGDPVLDPGDYVSVTGSLD